YVVHRNTLVTDETKVWTPSHFKRLLDSGFSSKKKAKNVKQRVIIRNADGHTVGVPDDVDERHQFALAEDFVFESLWQRASTVSLSPGKEISKISYVVDGVAAEREGLPRAEADSLLGYLKNLAGLNLDEKRKPQSGTITAELGETTVDIVVQTGGSTAGEKLTLQILGAETEYKIDDLGFTEEQLKTVRDVMHADKGFAVFSGPRGSGVTVTIYSLARSHDAFLNNIQTLETDREYQLFNITQHIFKPSDEKTFASEIQKIVRTDPDIIILPQPPDSGGAELASQAAAKKQNLYTTLVADDVLEALRKWIELVNDPKLVAKSLSLIVNQRLVRRLCLDCKQAYKPDPQMLRKANLPKDKVFHRQPEPEYDKHGNAIICQNCHGTGYVGRTGVFDVLAVDDGLRDVIRQGGSTSEIRAYLTQRGGGGLQQQALIKVQDGTTSIQEVIRVTRSPSAKSRGAAPGKARPKTKRSGAATPSAR
ncbi:MAG: Flp pilus assembly complex ATPase component TadA, partial [Planctomycetes bacterium]|nr:Flp pilus assembly complex ATPase component TadA [Planctomycetota bacterium]